MIHLEYNNLVNFLVSSKYISFDQIVNNKIIIEKKRTKNNTFLIQIKGGEGIFVKQFTDQMEYPFDSLWREEFIRLHRNELNNEIKNVIIPFSNNENRINKEKKVLITQLIPNLHSLKKKILDGSDINVLLNNLKRVIDALHTSEIEDLWKYKKRLNNAPILLERIFFDKKSKDGRINLIFWDKFKDDKKKIGQVLNDFWYESKTLIHNDLNTENILIDSNTNKFYIIDWEYLSLGDPLWDFTNLIIGIEDEFKEVKIKEKEKKETKEEVKIDLTDFDKNKLDFYQISIKLWLQYLDLKNGENAELLKNISENIQLFKGYLSKIKINNTDERRRK